MSKSRNYQNSAKTDNGSTICFILFALALVKDVGHICFQTTLS